MLGQLLLWGADLKEQWYLWCRFQLGTEFFWKKYPVKGHSPIPGPLQSPETVQSKSWRHLYRAQCKSWDRGMELAVSREMSGMPQTNT